MPGRNFFSQNDKFFIDTVSNEKQNSIKILLNREGCSHCVVAQLLIKKNWILFRTVTLSKPCLIYVSPKNISNSCNSNMAYIKKSLVLIYFQKISQKYLIMCSALAVCYIFKFRLLECHHYFEIVKFYFFSPIFATLLCYVNLRSVGVLQSSQIFVPLVLNSPRIFLP